MLAPLRCKIQSNMRERRRDRRQPLLPVRRCTESVKPEPPPPPSPLSYRYWVPQSFLTCTYFFGTPYVLTRKSATFSTRFP